MGGVGTCRQICDRTGHDSGLIAPRLNELAEMGIIRDSGERVPSPTGRGRPQTVWKIAVLNEEADSDDIVVTDLADEAPNWFNKFGQ